MTATEMTKCKAEQLLGLKGEYGVKDLTKAYHEAVKANHPDLGGSQDKTSDINAAEEYLSGFFKSDKSLILKATPFDSATDSSPRASSSVSATIAKGTATTNGAMPASSDLGNFNPDEAERIYYSSFRNDRDANDAEFTDSDYTERPQSEWNESDWEAFRAFRPTRSYRNARYFIEKMKTWDARYDSHGVVHEGNADVSCWDESDWYLYWFMNARNPRNDGWVYVSKAFDMDELYGPYAERKAAKKKPGYTMACKRYHEKNGYGWVDTPYGRIKDEPGTWRYNVGIPFAYAPAQYDVWLEANLEAQRAAIKNSKKKKQVPIAETYGWTGHEFWDASISGEDTFGWAAPTGAPVVDASMNVSASEAKAKAAKSSDFQINIDETWSESRKASKSSLNFGASKARRNDVDGGPSWYNPVNRIINSFPVRILFWAIAAIYIGSVFSSDPYGSQVPIVGAAMALCVVNIFFPVLYPVKALARSLAEWGLRSWAVKNSKKIDWTDHCDA